LGNRGKQGKQIKYEAIQSVLQEFLEKTAQRG
jgi:hypothetical protein